MEFTAIILAAGEGRRAHGFKPLFPLKENVTVVEYVIKTALTVCSEVRIVGGAQFKRLSQYLNERNPGIRLIHNRKWRRGGMFSSVLMGIVDVEGAAFVHPVDVVGAGADVYLSLSDAFSGDRYAVYRPTYSGRSGHPILLAGKTVEWIRKTPQHHSLREVLKPLEKRDVEVENELILQDFNTAEEFETLKKRMGVG